MRLFGGARFAVFTCLTLAFLCIAGLQGCSDDDDDNPLAPGPSPSPSPSPSPGTSQFTGVFAGSGDGGNMSLTIATGSLASARPSGTLGANQVTASGLVHVEESSSSINVTGTYDDVTKALQLSGGGYTFAGQYDATSSSVYGTYTGLHGAGSFRCAAGPPVGAEFCGVFESTANPGTFGRWNIVISGDQVHGVGSVLGGSSFTFVGTATSLGGTLRAITVEHQIAVDRTLTVDGQIDIHLGTDMDGTYEIENNGAPEDTGNWNGGGCAGSWVQTQQLTGTFIGASDGGLMTLTIREGYGASPNPVYAAGILRPEAGGTVEVEGFYNPEKDSLALSGSGYSFAGGYVYDPQNVNGFAGIVGHYAGPAGTGLFAFASLPAKAYCGAFQNLDMTAEGRWNLLVVGTSVVGFAVSTENDQYPLEGTLSGTGTTRTITLAADDGAGGTLSATGTLDTTIDTITGGTWAIELNSVPEDSGSWGGAACPGQATPAN